MSGDVKDIKESPDSFKVTFEREGEPPLVFDNVVSFYGAICMKTDEPGKAAYTVIRMCNPVQQAFLNSHIQADAVKDHILAQMPQPSPILRPSSIDPRIGPLPKVPRR